ncbi:MAG: DUF4417 domain-containing protein [Enterococcus sp.]|nr:DUF4417 domain-containing protein [Enterococcus sp.]
MAEYQNLSKAFLPTVKPYDIPVILPEYEMPKYKRVIEFDYCRRFMGNRKQNNKDVSDIGVHFFEDDYKFERAWSDPDTYGRMLSNFGFVIGPDFSVYDDFPDAIRIYNTYRNAWLCRYWQEHFAVCVIPTVMWGYEDTWDWCFNHYPKNSIVAVSNIGMAKTKEDKDYFMNGYEEMLKRLNPTKVLCYTRNFVTLPGNVEYVSWELYKGVQEYG